MAWGARQPHENVVATIPKQAQDAVHLSNSNGNYEALACGPQLSTKHTSRREDSASVQTSTKEPPGRHAHATCTGNLHEVAENRDYVRMTSEHSQTYRSLPQCLPVQQRHDSFGYDCCSTDEGDGGVLTEFT